jgi:hypothetical protein
MHPEPKLRNRRLALVAIGFMAAVDVYVQILATYAPASVPVVGMVVTGYVNHKTNFLYPSNWVYAVVEFTNKGTVSVFYTRFGDAGWVTAQTATGTTNEKFSSLHSWWTVLTPKASDTFTVRLPPNTLKWECGLSFHRASIRECSYDSKFWNAIRQLDLPTPLDNLEISAENMLPTNTGPECNFMSEQFVTGFTADRSPHP